MHPSIKKSNILIIIAVLLNTAYAQSPELVKKQKPTTRAITPAHRLAYKGWRERHEQIVQKVKTSDPKLVMIGDSITHNLDRPDRAGLRKQYLDQYNTINIGISGDRTENVIWRLQNGAFDGIKPKVATLLIGTNNTDGNHYLHISTPDQLAAGIWKICSIVRKMSPDTEIVLLGILPYGYKPNHRDEINKATNKIISRFAAKDPQIHYHDLGYLFLKDHGRVNVRGDLMPDYLHPNVQGETLILKTLAPVISKLMRK
ncbi:MAG: lipase [Verrucomicrobiae bacterium]|nr:lipase [Verrucomicrobiae bacterium]NNJ43928.1 lipase [Akkermansiaceae bacterium]